MAIVESPSPKMATGKRGTAPCGHPGTHVIGNYVECDQKCNRSGVPTPVAPEDTLPIRCRCPACGSPDTEGFAFAFGAGWHCIQCGKVW